MNTTNRIASNSYSSQYKILDNKGEFLCYIHANSEGEALRFAQMGQKLTGATSAVFVKSLNI